ncbi:unnamed protein product, partial [Didymodactylos carnosus]
CSIVIKDTTKTTSNFVKHLQTKHLKQHDEWKQLKTKENPVSQQRSITDIFGEPKRRKTYPSSHSSQKELSVGIVKHLIVEMGLPLSLVERNSFKMFMKLVDNKYKCISRRHITRSMLPRMNQKIIKKLKRICTDAKSVSLTLDVWPDRRLRSYFGITMHTIINNELKCYLLSFERLKGRHTAINILNEFNKVIKFYELESKLVRIVTDNANGDVHNSDDEEDNQQSITVLNDGQVNDDDEGEEDNSESEMAGGDEDDELTKDKSEKITKVAAIAKFSHKSSIFADRLENIKLSIPTANETRWNSQFYTLKAVYNIPHSELNMILNDLKKPELILSSTDKTVLTGFIQLLELFEEATMDAQSENHATISCVAPCILSVVHSLNSKKCDHLENMRVSLLLSMKARFSGLLRQFAIDVPNDRYVMAERFADPIFLLTPTLDVRFKLHWLNDIGYIE